MTERGTEVDVNSDTDSDDDSNNSDYQGGIIGVLPILTTVAIPFRL